MFLGIRANSAIDPTKVKRAYLSVSVDDGVGGELWVRQWKGWGEELTALDGINQDRGLTGGIDSPRKAGMTSAALLLVSNSEQLILCLFVAKYWKFYSKY